MNLVEMLKAALYGLVEGVTEWLPISSTGHMLLLNQFVPMDVSADFWAMFLVVVQLGAILAVLVLYFHQLNPFSPSKSHEERHDTWGLWAKIVVACLPAVVVGLPLDDWMSEHLETPYVIAGALVVYGVAFLVIETLRERKAARLAGSGMAAPSGGAHFAAPDVSAMSPTQLADMDAPIQDVSQIDMRHALGIGCFQVLSLVPGTSRSGSTIIGGLLLGCSRSAVAEFTFYLAIPVMAGASGLKLAKYFLKGNAFSSTEAMILVVGCVVAFVVSLLAIRFLVSFVKRHDFKPFGWYRIALGVVVIAYFALVG